MTPSPIYTADNLHAPAFHLRYAWSGWPSSGTFPRPPDDLWPDLDARWEKDGLRRLATRLTPNLWQISFSASPTISPTYLAARIKGRLQYALRSNHTPADFSRKVAVRSVGDNHTHDVETYIASQVDRSSYVDPRFKDFLRQFQVEDSSVDLLRPTATNSGRYWYNLHLVLVVRQRAAITDADRLATIRDWCMAIARKKGHQISRLGLMPDHLHLALRGNVEQSPQEIALAFLNNLAFALGQNAVWEYGYYAGTFGDYDMNAVRRGASDGSEED